MNVLFDEKGNLFGYISLYDYGKSGEKTKKFEYVLLDKNLNPFANKTFDGDITAGNYSGYINFDGKIVLRPTSVDASLVKKDEIFSPSAMLIDLKENTIRKKVYYEFDHGTFKEILQHDTWIENKREYKAEKRRNGFHYIAYVLEVKEGGFIANDYDDYGTYAKNCHIIRYDENKKELWRYEYGKNGVKEDWEKMRLIEKNEKYLFGISRRIIDGESDTACLVVIDMKTGQEIHKKKIPGEPEVLSKITTFPTYSYGELDNDKTFDDKIVIVGRTSKAFGFFTGFARLVIDKNTFDVDFKTLSYEEDFKPFVGYINAFGQVEKNYYIDPRDIFFHKDGSIGMLFEKFKFDSEYTAAKTTDMVYVYTDKNFKITGTKVFQKEKSRWGNADYLFSQYINNGNDLVFFYRDYQKNEETKDRNWNLFINTLIDGKFKQQIIPISSRKYFLIFPYIAKEGYILLQEFNKEAKYNQIRLERLNY